MTQYAGLVGNTHRRLIPTLSNANERGVRGGSARYENCHQLPGREQMILLIRQMIQELGDKHGKVIQAEMY